MALAETTMACMQKKRRNNPSPAANTSSIVSRPISFDLAHKKEVPQACGGPPSKWLCISQPLQCLSINHISRLQASNRDNVFCCLTVDFQHMTEKIDRSAQPNRAENYAETDKTGNPTTRPSEAINMRSAISLVKCPQS